jgi:hypothetical protein
MSRSWAVWVVAILVVSMGASALAGEMSRERKAPGEPAPVKGRVEARKAAKAAAAALEGEGAVEPAAIDGAPVFVTPPSQPTKVQIGVYLVALTKVDPPSESFPTFKAEIFLDLKWHDSRLVFDAKEAGTDREVFLEHEAELELERIWWPDVEFDNAQGERHVEARELVILPDGTVEYSERFNCDFVSHPDLRKFPFDSQHFDIRIESFAWDERFLQFVPYDAKIGFNSEHQASLEWEVEKVSAIVDSKKEVRSESAFSAFTLRIDVHRISGYYVWKIVLPLFLIVVFTWSTFWMPGEPASGRMQRAFLALLTVVAFNQVVSRNLPRISYITFMDSAVFLAFAFVGLTVMTIMYGQVKEHKGDKEAGLRLDRHARWVFPLTFSLAATVMWFYFH